MSAMADHDHVIQASILRGLAQVTELCEQMAAGYRAAGDAENGDYLAEAAARYQQVTDAAPRAWADADRLETMRALAAADPDAETASCDAPTLVLEV